MLVIPRQGPFEARQVPERTEENKHDHFRQMCDIATWCGSTTPPRNYSSLCKTKYIFLALCTADSQFKKAHVGDWIVLVDYNRFQIYSPGEFHFRFVEFGQLRETDKKPPNHG